MADEAAKGMLWFLCSDAAAGAQVTGLAEAFTEHACAATFAQDTIPKREQLFTEHAPSGRFGAVFDAFRERLFER